MAGQSSSPYDLALIFRALIEDPTTAAILTTALAQMPAVGDRSPGYQIQNQNPLLTGYPGNLGGKTGFTDAARHTFVTAAERAGRRLVVSVMDTENVPLRAADQAALLLDWGFAVPAGPGPATPPVRATVEPEQSPAVPAALAGGAVLIVAATVLGRRRAVRPVLPPAAGATRPRSAGGSTSRRP
jgi:D-alanyl-D-alanine carboxypeptidase (penicillin-binding protein 5/6)